VKHVDLEAGFKKRNCPETSGGNHRRVIIRFFYVTLPSDSELWPAMTELGDHTQTHHTLQDRSTCDQPDAETST